MEIPFGKILSAVGEGVIVFDSNGAVEYLNPHASLLLDCPADKALGRQIDDVVSIVSDVKEPVREKIANLILAVKKPFGSTGYNRHPFIKSQGQFFPVFFIATPIFDQNKIQGGIFIFRDITSEVVKEKEMEKSRSEKARLAEALKYKMEEESIGGPETDLKER